MTLAPSSKSLAAVVSIASNTLLIALKIAAGIITGSVGILSDAVHSLMDLVASLIAWASVRQADRPADRTHRYGHQKFEDLAASGQAVLLLLGAVVVILEAIRRLLQGGTVTSPGVAMIVAGFAAVVNVGVSTHLVRASRATGSSALYATAADLRTDAVVSTGVMLSLLLFLITRLRWIDPVVGMIIGLAISWTGIRILLGAGRRLADEALPSEELDTLRKVIESFLGEDVVGFHDVRARHVGNQHEVDLHLQFARGTTLERAHQVAHLIEDAITEQLPSTTVLVHLEPADRVRADRFGDD